jgi:hypothetical protein
MALDLDPEAVKTVDRIGQAIATANHTHDLLRPKENGDDSDDDQIKGTVSVASRPSGHVPLVSGNLAEMPSALSRSPPS